MITEAEAHARIKILADRYALAQVRQESTMTWQEKVGDAAKGCLPSLKPIPFYVKYTYPRWQPMRELWDLLKAHLDDPFIADWMKANARDIIEFTKANPEWKK